MLTKANEARIAGFIFSTDQGKFCYANGSYRNNKDFLHFITLCSSTHGC